MNAQAVLKTRLTLSVQEVGDGHSVTTLLVVDGGVLEHLLGMGLGSDPHILLPESTSLLGDIGVGKLLCQRDLLERERVDGGARRAHGSSDSGDNGTLHDCG